MAVVAGIKGLLDGAKSTGDGATRWLLRAVATAAIYWLAGKLALLMAIPPGYATAVWPAAGFALACVLFWGSRMGPAVAIGSFLVNVGTSFDPSSIATMAKSIAIASGIAIGAACQAVLGGFLIRRFVGFPTALEGQRDITAFLTLGGPVACAVNPTVGMTFLCGFGVTPWANYAFSWWTWWVGDAIGVLIFVPLILLLFPGGYRLWRQRRAPVGLPLFIGFAVVTALFLKASSWEDAHLRTDFESRATQLTHAIDTRLSEYQEVVGSVASFFDASPDVSRRAFREFSRRALRTHPDIQALGWNPSVPDSERARLEAAARREGIAGFEFKEMDARGAIRRAAIRSQYVPIYYLEPPDRNRPALGFDLASEPVRRQALERAATTGELTATPRITLIQETGTQSGILLLAPVFARHDVDDTATEPSRSLLGYVVGAFRIGDVADSVLAGLETPGMEVSVLDRDAAESDSLLYDGSAAKAVDGTGGAARLWSKTLAFGDRRWRIDVAATPAYMAAHRSWQAWMVLAGGLLLVGLLGVMMLMTTGRAYMEHESAERFRALVNVSAQIVWTVGANGEVFEDSPSWRAFTGQSYEQWRGWGWLDAIHPDDRDRTEQVCRSAMVAKSPIDIEYRIRHVSGEWRWNAARAVPLLDTHGGVRGWVGMNTDITDSKRATEQFRLAIEAAPTGMLMTDRTGKIVLVNTQIEKLFGYERNELIGRSVEVLVPEPFRARHPEQRAAFNDDRARPMARARDLYGLRKDGKEIPVEIGLNPVRMSDEEFVLSSVVDISERKQRERNQAFLMETSEFLRTSRDAVAVASQATRSLATCMGLSRCVFVRIDEATDLISLVAEFRSSDLVAWPGTMTLSGRTVTTAEQRAGRTTVIRDAKTDERTTTLFEEGFRPFGLRATIGVPLLQNGQWVASLAVSDVKPRDWTNGEVALVQAFADKVWPWMEHLRLSAEHREKEERKFQQFRLAVEAAPTGMILIDREGRIVLVNSHTENLFGYSREELVGEHFEMLVPEQFRSKIPELRRAFFADPKVWPSGGGPDLFGLRKDGTEVPIEVDLNPIRTPDGEFVLTSVVDTTERKRSAEQFRLAIEAAPTGMLMTDRSGKIVLVNTQIERLFGYERQELIGRSIEALVPERVRGRHAAYRAGFSHQPEARPMGGGRDLHGLRKDGTEVPIEIALNPIRMAEGDFVLSSVVDITERKHAEAVRDELVNQLKTLNVDLEERVRDRTAELSASLKEREVLLQEVHHRVKNNLQVISSLISMQVRRLEEGRNRDALEECQTRVQAIALIHEKLYQSRDYSRVPFSEYARSLASNVFHATGVSPTGVKLEFAIEDLSLPVDRAIPCGLVLNELITNALKHAFKDGRGGIVRVELTKLESGRLRLAVRDDGVGLPDELQIQKSKSLGLKLVTTLSAQLKADLEVNGRAGASFQLTFSAD